MSPILQSTEYIVSQTKNNIQFLQSINQISSEDARQILSKLPGSDRNLSSPPYPNSPPVPPYPGASNYRALWGYNENGQEAKNLTFNTGDVIQVIDKSDPNWWTGRLYGREGLFPSSYVESIPAGPQSQLQRPPPPQNFPNFPTGPHPYPQQLQYGPPPPGNMYPPNSMPFQKGSYPPFQGPPPPPGPVVMVNPQNPPKKQGLLSGNLGNTLVQSAVGGLGFGAGSAIAGDLVNSIF